MCVMMGAQRRRASLPGNAETGRAANGVHTGSAKLPALGTLYFATGGTWDCWAGRQCCEMILAAPNHRGAVTTKLK